MPQALKPFCFIQFWSWKNSLFPLLALWGNKNWPPSMKVKKMENFQNKRGLKGCNWSSLNAPGTETLYLIHLWGWENSLLPLLGLWGNKNGPPSMKVKKMENFQNKSGLWGCKWSSLNVPCIENPLSHSLLGLEESPFLIIGPLG